ncbi:MAG TPA: hypothetical protein VLA97_15410 [Nocardioidaceae bacterium]|nr:hypothetical protein [Nocardioidaceae bacterium]
MPSWTERLPGRSRLGSGLRAAQDVGPLLRFRASGLRGRARRSATGAFALIGLLTVAAGWAPAYLPGADGSESPFPVESTDLLLLLPSTFLGVLVIAIISAMASGGGRELLPRDQGVAYPVSPTTDHLGALLMAPLNIAWLLQSWLLLGVTAFVVGPERLYAAQLPALLWLVTATALAQAVAWGAEWVRRGAHGLWLLRGLTGLAVVTMAVLVVTERLTTVLDSIPTLQIVLGVLHGAEGHWLLWLRAVGVLVVLLVGAVVAGAYLAGAAARRPARDELRVETSAHRPRPNPASDLLAMVRVDRAGVWRSVPLRRGMAVLALLPGLVALAGGLEWSMLNLLPGLVASGGALLFGVNAWCLDGRGALWRASLPVSAHQVFWARVVVLVEVLLLSAALTLVLGVLRAGRPTTSEVVALVCCTLVVSLQVVSAALRWSVRRPFAVDLRSARATPAPPLVMVGYSSRLALSTTLTAMVFIVTSSVDQWRWSVLLAIPFLLFSAYRLVRVSESWSRPEVRARVAVTVAS